MIKNFNPKILVAIGLLLISYYGSASIVSAITVDEIAAQIARIQSQINAIQYNNISSSPFTQNLTIGSTGLEVVRLQEMLVGKDYLIMPAGVDYGYFGYLTRSAVTKWQSENDVFPAVGYWGPISRGKYELINGMGISGVVSSESKDLEWGAFVGDSLKDLPVFEQLVGEPVDIRAVFVNWGEGFPSSFASNLKSSGKKILIFWEQHNVSLDRIVSGNSDSYIKRFSEAAKNYGGEVILSPLHEMNGDWAPWSGSVGSNTPEKVVLAWKRIYDVFGEVPNVKFAWTVNNVSVPDISSNSISNYYPGGNYVDYVAVDGFNFGSPWETFDSIFDKTLKELAGYNKPIYILSIASAQGSKKASWINDFGLKVSSYPMVRGWVWFNENKEMDWRVNSDQASLEVFKSILP